MEKEMPRQKLEKYPFSVNIWYGGGGPGYHYEWGVG
jgi:hypothetical protein